ncbi:zinc-dependent alcohol dehydrogenase family protein [Tetragenococcus halophilus]|uniref:zinc-dependent alcohol dehydrogenase family protein n=1 Tax=Tetragenococcus halophilus TaxID=51669 RepID=UPI00209A9EF7|nr:zinc-dependent alcohol dehydrogenase family protein [Lactococcus lactis]MDN6723483.1 zinc-dependent alcohol dehydrogenase family protein [Tetragenococcus halophilus]
MRYKSLYYAEFGQPELVIQETNRRISHLEEDEALIEMMMAPINPSDLIPVTGAYAHRIPLPNTVGYEGVGVVKEVGKAENQSLVGKMVLPLREEGTWQEAVVMKVNQLIVVPEAIDYRIACQIYINPITAWLLCTKEFSLGKQDFLLVNAGNSSIGKIFIQLANILGFKMISVVRNEQYRNPLKKLGADYVINSRLENVFDAVMTITQGKGAQAAIDMIGNSAGTTLARCVANDGNFRTIGLLSGHQIDWQYIANHLNITAKMFHLRHWSENCSLEECQKQFETIFYLISEKGLQLTFPQIIYPFNQYKQAIEKALDPTVKSKVYLSFN